MEELNDVERAIVVKILANVEQHFVTVEEVEAYLWKLLDKETEFE